MQGRRLYGLINWTGGAVVGAGFTIWAALSHALGVAFIAGVYAFVCAVRAAIYFIPDRSDDA
jgi:hypothetical protein